jgi:hypothetical protein
MPPNLPVIPPGAKRAREEADKKATEVADLERKT